MTGPPRSETDAAHPNSRFTAPLANCPSIDPDWEKAEGVPITGIIYGGRRIADVPLVSQAFNWNQGVYLGATTGSEMTAAAEGKVGQLRRDPMAMLPFLWLPHGGLLPSPHQNWQKTKNIPAVFNVNWFRKDESGKFLWPGFGENMRVLRWIFERSTNGAGAQETPLGWMPRYSDIQWDGLNFDETQWNELMDYDRDKLRLQTLQHEELFLKRNL